MQRSTLADDLTCDDFLGGALSIWQPRKGYRAGVDAVLLAASVPAKPGQSVLELGCGVGTAALCLAARVPGVEVTGVEVQSDYAALAQKNGVGTVVNADLRELPADLRQKQFNHVMMNPPYFDRAQGGKAADAGRDIGRAGDTPLTDWLDVGIKRVGPKGHLTLIQNMTRLPEVICALEGRLGSIILRPIAPRAGQPANLFILQGQQDGRAAFRMTDALVMHAGQTLQGDNVTYTRQIQAVLRNAAPLPIGD